MTKQVTTDQVPAYTPVDPGTNRSVMGGNEELIRRATETMDLPHRGRALTLGRMLDESPSSSVEAVLDRLFPGRARHLQNRALTILLRKLNALGSKARSGFEVIVVGAKSAGAGGRTFKISRTRWSAAEMGIPF